MKCSLLNGTIAYETVETVGCAHIDAQHRIRSDSELCSLIKTSPKKSILYHPYTARKEPHIALVPTKTTFIEIFSPTEQYGATGQCTANHAPAGEGYVPVGEIESVFSIHFINCCRQLLVIVRQLVYNRLRQRPLGRFSTSPSFSSFRWIPLTVH